MKKRVKAVLGAVHRAGQSLKSRLPEWRNVKSIKAIVSLLVVMPLVFLGGRACAPAPEWQQMGVTNFDSVHLSDTSATATPILRVNQVGTGKIAEFLDNDTAAFSINDGGTISLTGALDLNGSELIMDADGDTTMIASSDDIITVTVNLTTGYAVIGVGNLKVGNGSPTMAQDGEDCYVEGGFEADGTARFDGAIDANSTADIAGNISSSDGAITMTDNIVVTGTSNLQGNVSDSGGTFTIADNMAITGQADAEQLVVTGYTTQTNPIFVVEDVTGTNVLLVANNGDLGDAGSDLTISDNFVVTGTSDLQGNISDSGGALTIADNAAVGGVSDAEQLVVTGYTTQTGSIFIVENITGTDVFQVSDLGVILSDLGAVTVNDLFVVQSTCDFQDSIADSTGDLTLADAVAITQTLDVYGNVSSSDGAITMTDNIVVTGTSDLQGNVSDSGGTFTIADNTHITGTANAIQLSITGYTTQTTSLLVLEKDDGTDVLTVSRGGNVVISGTTDLQGNISDSAGDVTIADALDVTSTLDALVDVDIGTWLNLSAQSTIALGADGTITPTGTYQVITSTAEVTTSTSVAVSNGGETGDLLILRNGNAANNINVDGTGANVECKANVALGPSDTLTLIWNGADWNCISNYDNS